MSNRSTLVILMGCIGVFIFIQYVSPGKPKAVKVSHYRVPSKQPGDSRFSSTFDSSEQKRPYVVNFWASWCTACKKETPLLVAFWSEFMGRGIDMVGIASYDKAEDSLAALRNKVLPYEVLSDEAGDIARKFDVSGLPQTFLMAPDGTVIWRRKGALNADDIQSLQESLQGLAKPALHSRL